MYESYKDSNYTGLYRIESLYIDYVENPYLSFLEMLRNRNLTI